MNYFKNGVKVFSGYIIAMIIYIIFIGTLVDFSKSASSALLVIYSFMFFLFLSYIIFKDMKKVGIKEKKPVYNLKPHPFKGLIYGVLGFSPFILIMVVNPFIHFSDEMTEVIKTLVINGILGPLHFILRDGANGPAAYTLAGALVPLISMLGYMAGYYGWERKKPDTLPT